MTVEQGFISVITPAVIYLLARETYLSAKVKETMASLQDVLAHAQSVDTKLDEVIALVKQLQAGAGNLTAEQQATLDQIDAALTDMSGKEDAVIPPTP